MRERRSRSKQHSETVGESNATEKVTTGKKQCRGRSNMTEKETQQEEVIQAKEWTQHKC